MKLQKVVLASVAAVTLASITTSVAQAGERPHSWSGFYLGGHLGYGWQQHDNRLRDLDGYNADGTDGDFNYNADGGIVGVQAGFNLQWQKVVVGMESDLGLGFAGAAQFPAHVGVRTPVDSVASVDFDRYATVTGRLGVLATDRVLIYAKAGWGWMHAQTSFIDPDPQGLVLLSGTSQKANLDGAVLGGGIEYALNSVLSLKIEYLHFNVGRTISQTSVADGEFGTARFAHDIRDVDTVKLGFNVKLGGDRSPGPLK
jgi:outer membrane immunogenic protein